MNELVSIISPCYNGEKFVGRFIESILAQTYDNIEFIIINDGSTDKTEKIILSYKEQFKVRGYSFIYLKQSNSGQSEAINKGLEIFKGTYLTWLDSDDYLPDYAIQKKVDFLNQNPQFGTVISPVKVLNETTYEYIGLQERKRTGTKNDTIFFDLITGHNAFISCGAIMVRTVMFREAMPKPLKILAPREIGQNFQLLLPIVYKYPVGYIDDICYYYFVREDSHSHTKRDYKELLHKVKVCENVLYSVTEDLTQDKKEKMKIEYAIKYRILKTKLLNMLLCKFSDDIDNVIREIKELEMLTPELRKLIVRIKYPMINYLFKLQTSFTYRLKNMKPFTSNNH